MDPPGRSESSNVESLVRLPGGFYFYSEPPEAPPAAPLPALVSGHLTFGCLNNPGKIPPSAIELFARVLRRVERSRILMVQREWGDAREGCRVLFASHGISSERVEFIASGSMPHYLQAHQRTDIALDSTPCCGGITTCDALLMGVPVISLAGDTSPSRAGASLLSRIGLDHLVAADRESFVEIAVRWSARPGEFGEFGEFGELADLRKQLPARLRQSSIMDAVGHVRELEAAYRTAWRRWRATRQPVA
jgi:predicted O-linked N-acetylglucosamine transferase (SPINDLY family)